ncbi:MAG: phosphate regulon transcriptional regulator PhoB [Enterobacterales bacterium]|nr:phosphate regulon transcriptional regulator PhoB [Enterobacterales bacterium]
MSVTILLVEDEVAIREMLRYALERQNYQVIEAGDATQARQMMMTQRPDLIVVDWMMPGESGVEFIRQIKRDQVLSEIPCMMLTARVEETDKVNGLDSGADDYMVKPVAIREFQARIKALLRRVKHSNDPQILQSVGIKLNLAIHQLTLDGQRVSIGASEFNLLKFFLSHKNKVYSRSQLLDYVWGQGVFVEERTVDVHMLRLRKILKPFAKDKLIQTIRGMGYMFSEDVV